MTRDSVSYFGRLVLTTDLLGTTELLPNAITKWKVTGFPMGAEVRYAGSRRLPGRDFVEYEYRGDDRFYKFRVPLDADPNVALAPLLSPHGRNHPRTVALLAERTSEIAAEVFSGPLAEVDRATQERVLAAVSAIFPAAIVRRVDDAGRPFIGLELAEEGLVYNDIRFTASERLARVFEERVTGALAKLAPTLNPIAPAAGLSIQFQIRSQNFRTRTTTVTEKVLMLAPASALAQYGQGTLSPQALLDQCVVTVDDVQTAVDLSLN
jgi:hypothetical protein